MVREGAAWAVGRVVWVVAGKGVAMVARAKEDPETGAQGVAEEGMAVLAAEAAEEVARLGGAEVVRGSGVGPVGWAMAARVRAALAKADGDWAVLVTEGVVMGDREREEMAAAGWEGARGTGEGRAAVRRRAAEAAGRWRLSDRQGRARRGQGCRTGRGETGKSYLCPKRRVV